VSLNIKHNPRIIFLLATLEADFSLNSEPVNNFYNSEVVVLMLVSLFWGCWIFRQAIVFHCFHYTTAARSGMSVLAQLDPKLLRSFPLFD
jgi:hypothetical protein